MDIILLQDVENLGTAGDIVKVKPGFARNFLIPNGLALRSSKQNLAVAEEKKRNKDARVNREAKVQQELATKISKIELTIEVQVGEEERLFGSVSSQDVHTALEAKGIAVERHDILLEEPIKSLGIYHIPIRVSAELAPDIKLYVIKA
ncbi:MAG: 50S ribosomal protein L9 [Candidatus Marinimicrobia bacterium]|nr:50S ribosomal protein L9 [Candidatus Neomarinimicrobiota bacterium]